MVSIIKAEELIRKGWEAYLATITVEKDDMVMMLSSTLVAVEYEDVFEALQELPTLRIYAFSIGLESGTVPVAKSPYRLALPEMAELKNQLEDLMDKGLLG